MRGKILIVEDDALNRRFFTDVLASEGYATITSERGEGVLELARAEQPNAILMDMCIPDADGLEVTRRIKADDETREIPVIAITAIHQAEDEALARAEGCVDYLRKPVGIPRFVDSVIRHARASQA